MATTVLVQWSELVVLEPRLEMLRQRMSRVEDTGTYFCAVEAFNGYCGAPAFKGLMSALVGHGAEQRVPLLVSPEAYDAAYATLIDALPPCRQCGCL